MENKILKLKNVSKFYSQKGQVTSGFSKVSVDLSMGEFVVIVGESGSGKSTLLNVLSGLDNYQEGEMYINGEETSHYTEKDFEIYRKKYIGNIFQNFNLVNSYTVYQNIELALLMNGATSKEVKGTINSIIDKVGLSKYRKQKVAKLSGGQKQRVAIARALAKETPIIVADEPTGNLDVESANNIFELLSEISKDKLVIIVTHNYEQVEKYATRKIRMHDGQIIEDEVLKPTSSVDEIKLNQGGSLSFFNQLKLSWRNTYNVVSKFLLLMCVFTLICCAVMSGYSTISKQNKVDAQSGYNYYFTDVSANRVVIKKNDGTAISDEEFAELEAMDNVDYLIKNDLTIDSNISVSNESKDYYLYGKCRDIKLLTNVDEGRLPVNDNEIVLQVIENDWYVSSNLENILNQKFYIYNDITGEEIDTKEDLIVVGVRYYSEAETIVDGNYQQLDYIYISPTVLDEVLINYYVNKTTVESYFRGSWNTSDTWNPQYKILPSNKVKKGQVAISSDLSYLCKDGKCKGVNVKVHASSLYFESNLNVKVNKTYTKKTFKKITGYKDYAMNNGAFFINTEDYRALFDQGIFQSSVYLKDANKAKESLAALEEKGYTVLQVSACLANYFTGFQQINQILTVCIDLVVGIVLFYIAYFIIMLIFKSRNTYYSTLRILGASQGVAKGILSTELFYVSNLAFILTIIVTQLANQGIIQNAYLKDLVTYLKVSDFVVLYLINTIVSFLISHKYSKKLFNDTAMNSFRQGGQ